MRPGEAPSKGDADACVFEALERADPRAALAALMQLYGKQVHRFCFDQLGDAAVSDDVLQTVFVQAYRDLPRFERRASLKTWLLKIARNRCTDELRRARRWRRIVAAPGVLPDVAAPTPGGEAEQAGASWRAAFGDCLDRLKADAKEAVLLRYDHQMSYDEIAQVTGGRAGTLRVRVTRALQLLRDCLTGKGIEP